MAFEFFDSGRTDNGAKQTAVGEATASWLELGRIIVYSDFGRSIEKVTCRLPSGVVAAFDVRHEPDTVAVFTLDTDGHVVLTCQYRPAIGAMVYEMPGGFIRRNESPLAAARRELEEETGYVGELWIVGHWYADSYSSAVKFCAVARNCRLGSTPMSDQEESIAIEIVSLEKFLNILRSGALMDTDVAYRALDALSLI